MLQVVTVVRLARNTVRLPLGVGIGKTLELRVGHEVLVEVETIEGDRMFRDLILKHLGSMDVESLQEARDLGGLDPHLDGAATQSHHRADVSSSYLRRGAPWHRTGLELHETIVRGPREQRKAQSRDQYGSVHRFPVCPQYASGLDGYGSEKGSSGQSLSTRLERSRFRVAIALAVSACIIYMTTVHHTVAMAPIAR